MPHDWLDLLRVHTDRFATILEVADLDAPVRHCPGWSVRDLAAHLGGIHQWAAHAVTEGDPGLTTTQPEGERAAVVEWYRESAAGLLDVLTRTPLEATAWTLDKQDRTAAFWRRRQVHETVMHVWDAEEALGTPRPIDPTLAWDGVLEVAQIMYPRQVRVGRIPPLPAALRLVATDVDGEVTLGDGAPLVVEGSAEVLLRLLWHRAPTDDLDPRAAALLAGAVTP